MPHDINSKFSAIGKLITGKELKMTTWTFTPQELQQIYQPDLQKSLDLQDLQNLKNPYLQSRAHHTLGYELWVREIENGFRSGMLHTVRETIHKKELLNRLDELGQEVGRMISEMIGAENTVHSAPRLTDLASRIRVRNTLQARKVVRYLEAAETALGVVVPPKLDYASRQLLADTYHHRVAHSYLPVIKTYYFQRAKFLIHLGGSPGTPFHPGRPPKREYGSTWYPSSQPHKSPKVELPWRPIYRPWADEIKSAEETGEWNDLETRIAKQPRISGKGKSSPRPIDDVEVSKPGQSPHVTPTPSVVQVSEVSQELVRGQYMSIEAAEGHLCVKTTSQVITQAAIEVQTNVTHDPQDLSKALMAFAQSESKIKPRGTDKPKNETRAAATASVSEPAQLRREANEEPGASRQQDVPSKENNNLPASSQEQKQAQQPMPKQEEQGTDAPQPPPPAIGKKKEKKTQASAPPRTPTLADVLFESTFPNCSFAFVPVSGRRLLCGIRALIESLSHQVGHRPDEETLLQIHRSNEIQAVNAELGQERLDNNDDFGVDQLGAIVHAWGLQQGLNLRLGYQLGDGRNFLVPTDDGGEELTTVWIASTSRSGVTRGRYTDHYHGIRAAADDSWGKDKRSAVRPANKDTKSSG
jgi:hypothetical protein